MDSPRMQMLTSILLTIMFLGAVVCNALPEKNKTQVLAKCPPGSYDASESGGQPYCLPCPKGHYNDEYNNFGGCKIHRVCNPSEEDVLNAGTATSNVVCRCKKGGRHYYDDTVNGYNCRECQLGNVSQAVARNAFDPGDTACCPNTTIAVRNNSRIVHCLRDQSYTAPPTQIPPSPKDDLTQSSMQWWVILGSILIGVLLGVIFTTLFLCLRKRRRRSKRSSIPTSSRVPTPIYRYNRASNDMPREETMPS